MSYEYRTRTTTIDRSELNRLQSAANAAQRAARENARLQRQLSNAQSAQKAMSSQHQREMKRLEQTLNRNAAAASAEAQRLQSALEKEIRDRNNAIARAEQNASKQISNVQNNFNQKITQMQTDFRNQMATVQTDLNQIHNSLNTMAATDAELRELAGVYYRNGTALAARVNEIPSAHTSLSQQDLVRLQTLQDNAAADIDNPQINGSTAYANARTFFQEALSRQQQAEAEEAVWQQRYEETQRRAEESARTLESLRTVEMDLLGDPENPVAVDVDHWSDGALTSLSQSVGYLQERLGKGQNTLTGGDLQNFLDALQVIDADASEATGFASAAMLESQRRADMNEAIRQTMEGAGFEMVGHGFEGTDRRGAHRVHFHDNNSGCDFYFTFSPRTDGDNAVENDAALTVVNCGGMTGNPELLQNRRATLSDALNRALAQFGVRLSQDPQQDTGAHIDRAVRSDNAFAAARTPAVATPTVTTPAATAAAVAGAAPAAPAAAGRT